MIHIYSLYYSNSEFKYIHRQTDDDIHIVDHVDSKTSFILHFRPLLVFLLAANRLYPLLFLYTLVDSFVV